MPGSVVTDIIEESLVKMKSNKLYSFWIVNPGASKPEKGTEDDKMYDSDEENEAGDNKEAVASGAVAAPISSPTQPANRNLQHIVRNEVNTQKRQKELAEEQLELHQANDNNVSQGAYVAAAVAVGGVVVGAMTFVSFLSIYLMARLSDVYCTACNIVHSLIMYHYSLSLIMQGIGLIPYFAVVGITAAASGGVVAFNSRRRPENSRYTCNLA